MGTQRRWFRTGVIVAVIACGAVTSALWIRSYWWIDGYALRLSQHSSFVIESRQGLVSLTKSYFSPSSGVWRTGVYSLPVSAEAEAIEMARTFGMPITTMPSKSKVGIKTIAIRADGRAIDSSSVTFPHWVLLVMLVFALMMNYVIRQVSRKRNPPVSSS